MKKEEFEKKEIMNRLREMGFVGDEITMALHGYHYSQYISFKEKRGFLHPMYGSCGYANTFDKDFEKLLSEIDFEICKPIRGRQRK